MAKIYYEDDADISLLDGKTIGIVGYGSQGHAHALNLHDNGQTVIVGLHTESKTRSKVIADELEVTDVDDLAKRSDIIMMLIPDHLQAGIYRDSIEPYLDSGKMLMWAHGFAIHYRQIVPPPHVDVAMIAPKAPGHRMRESFVDGIGVPALVAVHQNPSGQAKNNALAYSKGVGSTKAGVLETTFREETETDLFGEQSVLCGGVTSLIKAGFDTLVEAGYDPDIAYFECLHELKLIVDLIHQGGLKYMRYSVSDTAEYGDYSRGSRVIDSHVKENMKAVLKEVQDGTFAQEWISENEEGRKHFLQTRDSENVHTIEEVGEKLRSMMTWLNTPTNK